MDPEYARELLTERVSLEEAYERMRSTYDRLAAENAELKARYLHVAELNHNQVSMVRADCAALAAANATLDALREVFEKWQASDGFTAYDLVDAIRPILYPQPAALAEEKTNDN